MSDRNYTYITEISGPNADAAREAAVSALKSLSKNEGGWDEFHGSWDDDKKEYFDHDSGEGAVVTVGLVSYDFPTETYELFVNGGMAENSQGLTLLTRGQVRDGRSRFVSYGDPQEPLCEKCHPQEFQPQDLLTIDRTVKAGQVTCPQCHAVYEYVIKDGELVWWAELYDIRERLKERRAAREKYLKENSEAPVVTPILSPEQIAEANAYLNETTENYNALEKA